MAGTLVLAFPVYHDPPTMDRYFAESCQPLPPRVIAYGDWIRGHTGPDAIFVTGSLSLGYMLFIPSPSATRVRRRSRTSFESPDTSSENA